MSRTKKQPYTKAKAVDKSCRNHGSCPHCQKNRKHKTKKREPVEDKSWPTLEGRLNQPITSDVEAISQLQDMKMPLSQLAKDILKKGNS